MSEGLFEMNVSGRLYGLADRMAASGLDAVLITNLTNIRYLTGFTGSAAQLAVVRNSSGFIGLITTDGRYDLQIERELAANGVTLDISVGSVTKQATDVFKFLGTSARIGFEGQHLSYVSHQKLASQEELSRCELIGVSDLVEGIRITKDPGEIARIDKAASIADAAFGRVVDMLTSGLSGGGQLTEADVAIELDHQMRLLGASEPAFETIVAGGESAAMPHHRADSSQIVGGTTIVFDFGATYDGYRSDMTRTVCVGNFRDPVLEKMWKVVFESQAEGLGIVKSGVSGKDIDNACRKVIDDAGWKENFSHSTGHGVGLDIHEMPWVSQVSDTKIGTGMVITVEPGVYIEGLGGVRIEDTVVVTDDGFEYLTKYPKVPILL